MTISTTFLKYGDTSERQRIKKYVKEDRYQGNDEAIVKEGSSNVGIIAIHGGAWRDPNNTCNDFDKFADFWLNKATADDDVVCVYSLDYKLSSEEGGMFPSILDDVVNAMKIIKNDSIGKIHKFIICGHSVGCTFITQILEFSTKNNINLNITKAVFLDGIYDIKSMLNEYPSYDFFVIEAFGDINIAIKECNAITRRDTVPKIYKDLKEIIIVHSLDDELLSLKQPSLFAEWLHHSGVHVETMYGHYGLHNDVYVNPTVARCIL